VLVRSVTPRILHIVVNRMIVSRNGLDGCGMHIGECTAWGAEYFMNAQDSKHSRRYNGEVVGVKGDRGFRYVCCRIHVDDSFNCRSSRAGLSLIVALKPSYPWSDLWLLQPLHRRESYCRKMKSSNFHPSQGI
jgi:hypothetical protein